jgi:hypothetical protein
MFHVRVGVMGLLDGDDAVIALALPVFFLLAFDDADEAASDEHAGKCGLAITSKKSSSRSTWESGS